jgi:hypothetical protein
MEDVMAVANSPALWFLSILIVSLVVVQALLFMRMTLRFSDRFGVLTAADKRTVYQTAVINSIGPAVAVFFVAVSLIALVGAPVTLMRVGVIGSAVFELYAANQGAAAAGAEIGTDSFTLQAFTAAVWAMTLGGMGWLVTAYLFTKRLGNAQATLKRRNPALLITMGSVTPIAIFGVLVIGAVVTRTGLAGFSISVPDLCAVIAAASSMLLFGAIGRQWPWLKEWGLGFSLLIGLAAGYLAGQAWV